MGPKKALKLIQEHKSLENVMVHLKQAEEEREPKKKYDDEETPKKRVGGVHVPELWPYEEARELFKHPQVVDGASVQACF